GSTQTCVFFSHFLNPQVKENCRASKPGRLMTLPLSVTKHLWSNSATGAVLKLSEIENVALPRNLSGVALQLRFSPNENMRWLLPLTLTVALAGCGKPLHSTQIDPNGQVEVAIPEHGAYTGAFMDFGDAEDDVTLETIEDFEEMVGKHQAIIASSSYWGEQNFPVDNLNVIWRHGSLPLVFWSPWDKPYEE